MLPSEISAEQLKVKLDAQSCIVLYTTMQNVPAVKAYLVEQHPESFIPSAQLFDFQNVILDVTSSLNNTMPPIDVFEREVRRLGINLDKHIVVYDDFGNFCASRVWFMFKSMGHNNIKVLKGGLEAWIKAGYDTQSDLWTAQIVGNFIARPNSNYQFVDKDFIAKHVIETDETPLLLFDARSEERFSGKNKEQRSGMRSGHIPNSFNIYYKRLQHKDGAYLSLDEIEKVFVDTKSSANIPTDAMAFTCGSGVTACILAQAADALGHSPLYVYDGSWSEWGAHSHLPIRTGE